MLVEIIDQLEEFFPLLVVDRDDVLRPPHQSRPARLAEFGFERLGDRAQPVRRGIDFVAALGRDHVIGAGLKRSFEHRVGVRHLGVEFDDAEVIERRLSRSKAEIAACQGYGANLGIAFQLIDDALDYGGSSSKLGKNVGDDFREGKITLPVVLSFRRGGSQEREFWRRTLEKGEVVDGDLEFALATMKKHRALEDTIERARHYGAMARDALELFAASPWKRALRDAVEFTIGRAH